MNVHKRHYENQRQEEGRVPRERSDSQRGATTDWLVLVKLYEYSVNTCQQRRYYFKIYVWEILAVYINIYYLYFVFEIADTGEKSGDIYCCKDIKKKTLMLMEKSVLLYLVWDPSPPLLFDLAAASNG